jgi:hypothetical protein
VSRKAIDMRHQGFSGAAMLPMAELEYSGVMDKLSPLEKRFVVRTKDSLATAPKPRLQIRISSRSGKTPTPTPTSHPEGSQSGVREFAVAEKGSASSLAVCR